MSRSKGPDRGFEQAGSGPPQAYQDGRADFPQGCFAALILLMDAHNYARKLGRSSWDFAVEIDQLRALRLTNNEFRWLVCKGLVEHGTEVTQASERERTFEPSDRLTFCGKTCFVLSDAGLQLLRNTPACSSEVERTGASTHNRDCDVPHDGCVPKWDRERRELRVGALLVKQFKAPAPNQQMILAAFEEESWPAHIFDPLPQDTDQDPKRRLHDTINSLNRNQKHPLIHFAGDGSGEGVCWELLRPGNDRGESTDASP